MAYRRSNRVLSYLRTLCGEPTIHLPYIEKIVEDYLVD